MSAVIEDRTTPRVVRAMLWAMCLLVSSAVGQQGVGNAAAAAADPLAAAREALAQGSAPDSVLAVHAGSLAQAGDLETLAGHLVNGQPAVVSAVLGAVQAHGVVGLLPELVAVAADADDNALRSQAGTHLAALVEEHASVRADLSAFLGDPELPLAHRRQVIVLLGGGRDLSVVEPLLAELGGPLTVATSEALARLSGHPRPSEEDAASYWPTFWEQHAGVSRERLIEQGQAVERAQLQAENQRLKTQIERLNGNLVQARLEIMDDTLELLIAGLTDEYTAVRLEAARRLASHGAHEQARASLPVLLARLGAGEDADGQETRAPERSPEVRAAVVAALGVLGRDRPEVQRCLLGQVHAEEDLVAAAAVDALANVRDQPDVVVPLLEGLAERTPDEATLVKVLGIVSANQPSGVLDDLRPYLAESRPEEVRRWAVRAVLACRELEQALDEVTRMALPARSLRVRFALASGLGDRARAPAPDAPPEDRARALAPDAPERGLIRDLLAELLSDPEASVRAEAASSLGESGDPEALALLTERARQEIDASVLQAIIVALGDLGDQQAVDTIGRVVASGAVDGGAALAERAQQALVSIGGNAPPSAWLAMAETLRGVGALKLALFAVNDVLFPTRDGAAADQSVSDRARGLKVYLLQDLGQHADARELLLQIQEAGGPQPPAGEREELLARSCRALGLHDEAADWWTARLAALEESDPRYRDVQRELALALMETDRHDECLAQLTALSKAAPEDNDVMLWIGKVRMAKGEDADAAAVFARLLERLADPADPIRVEAVRLLGQLTPPTEQEPAEPAEDAPDEPALQQGDGGTQPEVGSP